MTEWEEAFVSPSDEQRGPLCRQTMFTSKVSILAATLTVLYCTCSGCATNNLADYPDSVWPALRQGASCLELSGSYQGVSTERWPTALSRGNTAIVEVSLASLLAEISPSSRPENLATVTRVEIDVSSSEARFTGAWNDRVSLEAWTCKDGGVLATSIAGVDESEGGLNNPLIHDYELRQAADRSLIVRSLERFTHLITKDYLRETWYRFPPNPPPETEPAELAR